MTLEADYSVYAAMQTGEPIARFKKTIVGKVHVVALNPFSGMPEGILLEGNDDKSYIEIYDTKALAFFKKLNKPHFDAGRLQEMKSVPTLQVSPNVISDEEIDTLLTGQFMTLKHRVDKFTSTAPLLRILNRARELDKSERLINFLEKRMADLDIM